MIIFRLLLTTFKADNIFEAAEIGLSLKWNHNDKDKLAQISDTHVIYFISLPHSINYVEANSIH